MSKLFEIADNINDFMVNLEDNIQDAVVFVENDLLDLNREQMRLRQVDAKDQAISPPYNPAYKAAFGKRTSNPDLFLSGDFQKNMVLNTNGVLFEIHSLDYKDARLRIKYGEEIFGIAPSNKTKAYSLTNHSIGELLRRRVLKKG